jgi:hypothetical protein
MAAMSWNQALAVAALLLPLRALAQAGGPVTGTITGVVLDAATQAPLADAVVIARSPALTGEQGAVTDQSGAFEITLLPVGTYSLSLQHDGFVPFAPEGVGVRPHRAIKIKLLLLRVPEAKPLIPAVKAVEFNDATMTAPVIISGPPPEYSQDAIDREVEGLMVVRCVVTVEGFVHSCKVLKSLPFMDRPVIFSLEKRRYKPALQQGKPVDVFYTFNVRLKLPSQ